MKIFNFFRDAGHGWLEVDKNLIKQLKIEKEISEYSYQHKGKVYLEEDCDAGVLIEALKGKGISYNFKDIYEEYTPIRSYARYAA